MADIELVKSDLHADLLEVKNPPSDAKERTKVASRLRNAAKREGTKATIAQRGNKIFVATSSAAEKALPAGSGRGRKGLSLSDLIKDAS